MNDALLITAIFATYGVFWCVLMRGIASFSGWRDLSEAYPGTDARTRPGRWLRVVSAQMRRACGVGAFTPPL